MQCIDYADQKCKEQCPPCWRDGHDFIPQRPGETTAGCPHKKTGKSQDFLAFRLLGRQAPAPTLLRHSEGGYDPSQSKKSVLRPVLSSVPSITLCVLNSNLHILLRSLCFLIDTSTCAYSHRQSGLVGIPVGRQGIGYAHRCYPLSLVLGVFGLPASVNFCGWWAVVAQLCYS